MQNRFRGSLFAGAGVAEWTGRSITKIRRARFRSWERGVMKLRLFTFGIVLALVAGFGVAHADLFDLPIHYYVNGQPRGVFSADFNGDGHPDIATVSYQTDSLTIMLNNGDGSFGAPTRYATGDAPVSVYGADVDADSVIDLAVANKFDNTISLFIGYGDGTFASQQVLSSGYAPSSVLLADLDGTDGPDLIATNEQITLPFIGDSVSVLFNNGDGTFQTRVSFEVGCEPQKSIAVDLNADSSLDLAVVNTWSHTISVLLNDGTGNMGPSSYYDSHHVPMWVSAADLDNDGDVDLVAPNMDSYDWQVLSVILNNGDGSFASTVYYNCGSYPCATFTADLDQDNDIDIVVTNKDVDSISVLLNYGDGTFAPIIQFAAGGSPGSLSVADLNNDSYMDLSVGTRSSNEVLVYMNTASPSSVGDDDNPARPVGFVLMQNRPNPFNPSTVIEYELDNRVHVSLTVYNVLGQRVVGLVDAEQSAGQHQVNWDGLSDSQTPVAGGVYFYRLIAGDRYESKKMVLVK